MKSQIFKSTFCNYKLIALLRPKIIQTSEMKYFCIVT